LREKYTFSGGKILFYYIFKKQIFLGTTNFARALPRMPPVATGLVSGAQPSKSGIQKALPLHKFWNNGDDSVNKTAG